MKRSDTNLTQSYPKRTCTACPQISAQALISYRASNTLRSNETKCLFMAGRFFPII